MARTVGGVRKRDSLKAMAVAGACMALSACGVSNITAPFSSGGGLFGSTKADATGSSSGSSGWTPTVTESTMLAAAQGGTDFSGQVGGGCPAFAIGPGEATITVKARVAGVTDDQLSVMHRGEITKTARECGTGQNGIAMKLGIAGRVLLGPQGKGGNIVLPLKLTIVGATPKPMKPDVFKVPVTVPAGQSVGYFSLVREITVPSGNVRVNVGFDRSGPNVTP